MSAKKINICVRELNNSLGVSLRLERSGRKQSQGCAEIASAKLKLSPED